MNKAFVALGVVIISVFCCCAPYSPFASILTVEKPDSSDVVGIYQMTGQNLDRSASFPNKHPEISINSDGSCSVKDFPVWELDISSKYSVVKWLTFEGTWGMGEFGSVERDNEVYNNWALGCGNNAEKMNVTGELANDKPPYDILFIYDDPDSGYAMTFKKVP